MSAPASAENLGCGGRILYKNHYQISDVAGQSLRYSIRLREIARFSCVGPIGDTQRLAMDAEFQAIVDLIDELRTLHSDLEPEVEEYIEHLLRRTASLLDGVDVLTRRNSCRALRPAQRAIVNLVRCS